MYVRRTVARRALGALVLTSAVGAAGALPVGAAVAAPVTHDSFDPVGDVFVCGDRTYTVVDGTIKTLDRFSVGPTGNEHGGFVLRLSGVVAEDSAGDSYELHGVVRNAFNYRAGHGDETASYSAKVRFVQPGTGNVDSVSVLFHNNTVNGKLREVDIGSCELP